jgi:chromosome segregation ATPase
MNAPDNHALAPLEEIKRRLGEASDSKARALQAEKERDEARAACADLEAKLSHTEARVRDLEGHVKFLDGRLAKRKAENEKLKAEIQERIDSSFEELSKKSEALKENEKLRAKLTQSARNLGKSMDACASLVSATEPMRALVEKLHAELKELREGSLCPDCEKAKKEVRA